MRDWCPIMPKDASDEVIKEAMPGIANADCQSNMYSLDALGGEQLLADTSWQDTINVGGQDIYYYIHEYVKERADKIYKEDLLSSYLEPWKIKALIEFNDAEPILGSLGGQFHDLAGHITAHIHIKTFRETALTNSTYYTDHYMRPEPKINDVIRLINRS